MGAGPPARRSTGPTSADTAAPVRSLVGREADLAAVAAARAAAGNGSLSAVVVEGEPGIGKTALLDAAARAAALDGWRVVATLGVETDAALPYAALYGLLAPLRDWLPALPSAQADALASALGWRVAAAGERFLVGAATLGLLAEAAAERPLLVLVDDLPWIDQESAAALGFAAHRMRHDRVTFLAGRRSPVATPLPGFAVIPLGGLDAAHSRLLLGPQLADRVADRLVAETGGNPLALLETGRVMTPAQRAGAADLPHALPVPQRLGRVYADELAALSPSAWQAVLLAAASIDRAGGPVAAALTAAGHDAEAALDAAAGVVQVVGGLIVFRHPLLRSAAWHRAGAAERRRAHRLLADAVGDGPTRTWHRAETTRGFDPGLADELGAVAELDRSRRAFSAASAAAERAGRLVPAGVHRVRWLARAAEDAYLAGDGERTRQLAEEVLGTGREPEPRARALVALGQLEQYRGPFAHAHELFLRAAELATGRLLLHALVELAATSYLLDDRAAMTDAADRAVAAADPDDPEQAMLAAYLAGAAAVFTGRPEAGAPLIRRAMALLESEPSLRDDPRHLPVALLCPRWLMDPAVDLDPINRRLRQARAAGALGPLALGLSLAAGGLLWLGEHVRGYAVAGEAVELLDALGYHAEPGVAHESLATECAARGLHADADALLQRAVDVQLATGFTATRPHLAHAMISCALSRGDLDRVVALGEEQITRYGGAGPLLEPLGVAPALIEAYLGLGRDAAARSLLSRYRAAQPAVPPLFSRGLLARCEGLLADDPTDSDRAFARAVQLQQQVGDRAETGRTRLWWGSRLRRAGQRTAARVQLREAIEDFAAVQHDAWRIRAQTELTATGERVRPRTAEVAEPLTAQETRVALLVADGLTNREAAAALFLSPRTVEHHLGAVLRKRGLRSRTELARDLAGRPEP